MKYGTIKKKKWKKNWGMGWFLFSALLFCAVNTAQVLEAEIVEFTPTDDAFTENGANNNTNVLKVEAGSRVRITYLKFDLTGLQGTPDSATLVLQEATDVGSGPIICSSGSHNNWEEETVTGATAPTAVAELDRFEGQVTDQLVLNFDVSDFVTGTGIYSFVVSTEAVAAEDVAFASKEYVGVEQGPKLVVSAAGGAVLIAPEIDKSITTPYDFEWRSSWPGGAKQVIKYLMYLDPNEVLVADEEDRKLPGGTRWVEDQLVLAPVLDPNGPVLYNVTETLDFDTPYYWAVDTYVGEPNVGGIGFINVECIPGDTWRFWGPLSQPDLTGPEDVYILPDPLTHEFPANPQASFTVTITSAFDVHDVLWYKESDPGNAILSVGRFSIVTTDTESTLTISDVATTDNDTYYCVVRLDIEGNPGTPEESDHAILVLSSILRHRYSFSGNANDSVGGAHGTVQDPGIVTNITFSNGQVVFDDNLVAGENQTSDDPNLHWVDLPNGIVSALGDHATFMIWYTIEDPAAPDNVRVFTAGDADGSGTEAEYIDGAWTGMTGDGPWVEIMTRSGNISFGSRGAGAVAANDGAAANYVGQEICLAGVWDGSNSQMILYVNSAQTGTATPQRKLADLADVSNWLGRSNSTADKAFIGKINELRIYDVPLTRHWIEAMCEAGPDMIDVNPCLLDEYNPRDHNNDCVVDMLDFAEFAKHWLYCGLLNCP